MIDNAQRELFAGAVLKVLDANNTRFGLMGSGDSAFCEAVWV